MRLFAVIGRRLSVLETNIAQTAGAAAGGMAGAAGLLNVIPAMQLLGHEFAWPTLVLWALAVSFLGVFFAVPLRRQFIEVDKLRFPTGTATAATILAMNSESGDAIAKAKALIWSTVAAGAFTLAYFFVPQLENPPLEQVAWNRRTHHGRGVGFQNILRAVAARRRLPDGAARRLVAHVWRRFKLGRAWAAGTSRSAGRPAKS